MKYYTKFRIGLLAWIIFSPFVIVLFGCALKKVFAQKSILPYNYAEWKQPIRQTNTMPLFRYDTTENGIRITKVAELKNGSWVIFDSVSAETIINNEYLKIKR